MSVRSDLRRRVLATYSQPATVEDAARSLGESTERVQAATYYLKRRKLLKEVGTRGQFKLYQAASKKETAAARMREEMDRGTAIARLERMSRDLTELAQAVEIFLDVQQEEVERLRKENAVLRRTVAELNES